MRRLKRSQGWASHVPFVSRECEVGLTAVALGLHGSLNRIPGIRKASNSRLERQQAFLSSAGLREAETTATASSSARGLRDSANVGYSRPPALSSPKAQYRRRITTLASVLYRLGPGHALGVLVGESVAH